MSIPLVASTVKGSVIGDSPNRGGENATAPLELEEEPNCSSICAGVGADAGALTGRPVRASHQLGGHVHRL